MKNILIAVILVGSLVFSQGTQIKLYDYQLQANANLKIKNGKIGFVTMKPVAGSKEEAIFGYWLSNNTNANSVFLEIKEGGRTISSVTAKDFSAKAKMQSAGSKTIYTYSIGSGANASVISIESEAVNDDAMPLGKSVMLAVKVKVAGKRNLSAVMTLYADGFLRKVGTNGVANSRVENGKADAPFVLLIGSPGSSVSTANIEQKTAGKLVTIASEAVSTDGEVVTLISFRANGSTVKDMDNAVKQIKNIETIVVNKKEVTELSIINSASRTKPFPGDTILYTIAYHNIGNSPAQDAVITNDIPVNMYYVENSAAGENSEISFVRKTVALPQQGEVVSVNWKIMRRILPGEEGTVSLKAVVR